MGNSLNTSLQKPLTIMFSAACVGLPHSHVRRSPSPKLERISNFPKSRAPIGLQFVRPFGKWSASQDGGLAIGSMNVIAGHVDIADESVLVHTEFGHNRSGSKSSRCDDGLPFV